MKVNLKLKNFQSISDANLEFDTGINLIVGSNSSGKSAVLRALYSVTTNPSYAKRYIQHGKTQASVFLSVPNYNIEWYRKDTGVRYIINGSENTKCGRSTLFDFCDIPFTYDENSGNVLNFQTEHDGLFPFNKSNVEMFKLFEDIFQISDSSTILDSIKKDEQDTNKNVSNLKIKQKEIEDKISYLTEFNNEFDVNDVYDMKKECVNMNNDLKNLKEIQNKCEVLDNNIQYLDTVLNIFNDGITSEDIFNALEIISDYLVLKETMTEIDFLNDISLLDIPETMVFDLDSINDYFSIKKSFQEIQEIESFLNTSFPFEDGVIFDVDSIKDFLSFKNDYLQIELLVFEIKNLKNELSLYKDKVKELQEELNKIPYCPLCNNEIINHVEIC